MNEDHALAERFESNRAHLEAVAYRMLGSVHDADDAVQETWLRLNRSDVRAVENLTGWLTTVVARVCLDMLRSRKSRREEPFAEHASEAVATHGRGPTPEEEAVLEDSVGIAMLVVLDRLAPAERIAFVLHDLFDVPFDEIASIVGRTPAAARQLASRARRRVREAPVPEPGRRRQQEIVDAFLAASRNGDFAALLALLDPEVVFRADSAAVRMSASGRAGDTPPLESESRGATTVARLFCGRLLAARPALVSGAPGLAWTSARGPQAAMRFTIVGGTIVQIELIADAQLVRELDLVLG